MLGEESFLPIFDMVYDSTFHDAESPFDYGKEFYHFSIGLIFRTVHCLLGDYINADEVGILTSCKYLIQDT